MVIINLYLNSVCIGARDLGLCESALLDPAISFLDTGASYTPACAQWNRAPF
jgi:hypothetical protein